jgi:trk system potassium uptake protein TrkH
MVNFRIVAKVYSQALIIEGFVMLIAAAVSFIYSDPNGALVLSGIITVICGGMVYTPLRKEEKVNGNKEGYLILVGTWLIISLVGTLPYLLSGAIPNFGDAFFESVSGFTTTGATVIGDLETLSHGILFWRSATQWIGGLFFIIISLSILPVKQFNIQLSIDDFSGVPADKINPRTIESVKRLFAVYMTLTVVETILLWIGGMPLFDSVCHSMSTVSTGGFSTNNDGLSAISSVYTIIIMTIFMFLSGANMTLFYFGAKKRFSKITRNNEFFFYLSIFILFAVTGAFVLVANGSFKPGRSFLESSFHTASMISTTGYFLSDYNTWGSFMVYALILLMIIGSSSCSAGGGLKAIRLLLLGKIIGLQMKNTIHPNAVVPLRMGDKIVSSSMATKVLMLIIIYLIILSVGAIILSLMGYDTLTSFSFAASMLSNVGHAPGSIGPFGSLASLPMVGKQFLVVLMIVGRVEFISLFILITKGYYKN